MDNNFELIINGHTFTGMVDDGEFGDMQCFFDFHLKPDSSAAAQLGGTHFRCSKHLGHAGKHAIQTNQMVHEVNISFPPK